jgi:hypothetical protein
MNCPPQGPVAGSCLDWGSQIRGLRNSRIHRGLKARRPSKWMELFYVQDGARWSTGITGNGLALA